MANYRLWKYARARATSSEFGWDVLGSIILASIVLLGLQSATSIGAALAWVIAAELTTLLLGAVSLGRSWQLRRLRGWNHGLQQRNPAAAAELRRHRWFRFIERVRH